MFGFVDRRVAGRYWLGGQAASVGDVLLAIGVARGLALLAGRSGGEC